MVAFSQPVHPGLPSPPWRATARAIGLVARCLAAAAWVWSGAAQAGSVQQFRYPSPALGREQTAQVYVPSGDAPAGGWRVLYLLHGLGGRSSDWQALGKIGTTLDRMVEQKQIGPLVVVMPEAANSWYVDSADIAGPGNYASAIGHDLPAAIEEAFDVGHDRAHRAIAGLSMGGFGALRLALSEPERYGAAAALSPAIWQNVPLDQANLAQPGKPPALAGSNPATSYFSRPDPTTVTVGIDLPPPGEHFGGAFGTPFDPRRFNAENVFTLLQRAIDSKKRLPSMYLTVGDDDSHLLWRGAIAFFETMQMDGRPIEFRVTDGDHNWNCWKTSIVDALLFIDKNVGRDEPRT